MGLEGVIAALLSFGVGFLGAYLILAWDAQIKRNRERDRRVQELLDDQPLGNSYDKWA
tara:strand:+ start:3673 stop:3846 length:174 start_codon:yes stop_codon:yes gene_type:complete